MNCIDKLLKILPNTVFGRSKYYKNKNKNNIYIKM